MTVRRLVVFPAALAAAGGSVLAAEGGGSALIQPHIGTAFWTLVTFVIMAWVLGRYAWRPLLGALEQRERSIEGSLDEARRQREEAERLLGEQRALLLEARRERADAVAAGQRDAERLKGEILDEARSQREQLLRQTEKQVEAGVRQARSELRDAAVDLAIQAAGKLLATNLDDATQRRLVEEYLSDLEGSGPAPRRPS